MSISSKIEWTQATWNPVTGCKKLSPACINCYAETFANRFKGVRGHPYEQGFQVKLWPERLTLPLSWRKARFIFVNSMSDLFLEDVTDDFIETVFATMCRAKQHVFQVLTKRPKRMLEWTQCHYKRQNWPENVWLGVSIENNCYLERAKLLSSTPAKIKFISFEPLLGPIQFKNGSLKGISWVIVGGESGPRARPMKSEWVDPIFDYCRKKGIAFFFKQWGTFDSKGIRMGKKKAGRKYKGKLWNEMPSELFNAP